MSDTCTAVELTALIAIQARTINDLAKRGVVVRAGRGRYARDESVRSYCAYLRELAPGRGGASATVERARLARAQAELVETKGRKLRGELVNAAEVEAE